MIFDKLFNRKIKSTDLNEAEAEAELSSLNMPNETMAPPEGDISPHDDDNDPMMQLPGFEPDRNEDDEFDLLSSLSAEDEPEASKASVSAPASADDGTDFIDLDDQIEQLLKADTNASENFVARDASALVQNKTIYDGEFANEEDAETEWGTYAVKAGTRGKPAQLMSASKPKGLAVMPLYQFVIIAGLTLAIIIGMGFTALATARIIVEKNADEASIAHFTPLTQPINPPNNANYMFINEHTLLSGQSLTLTKISAGSTGTFFYFNEVFDPDKYTIALYDQNNDLYHRSRFDMLSGMTEGTILKFDALKVTTIFLTLFIQDSKIHESVSFHYRFEEYPTLVMPVYFNEPIKLFEDSGMDFQIHHAVLDNASTEIYYSFNSEGGTGELCFGDYSVKPMLQVTESIHNLPAMTLNPAEARFDDQNIVLGKLNLSPVKNLKSTLEITFNDLYYRFAMPKHDIDLPALFERLSEEQVYNISENQLILHGMAKQGNTAVLVLQGKDDRGRLLETRVDATLSVETEKGLIKLEGTGKANAIGNDTTFDLKPYENQLRGIPISEYRLDIHAVEYRIPKFTVDLDLNMCMTTPERRMESGERQITAAFLSRLQYKSHEILRDEIIGFSEELIADRSLMRPYAPVGWEQKPMYAVHVVSSMITPKNEYIAVVEDVWMSGTGVNMTYLRQTHQIVAERTEEGWIIVSDIIIPV